MYRKKRPAHTKNKEELKQSGGNIAKRTKKGQKLQKSSSTYKNRRGKASIKCSNIENPSGRVTVPLDFFSQGVKSGAVKVRDGFSPEESSSFMNEGLHPLLQTADNTDTKLEPILRRSKRLSARSPSVQTHYKSITDYYVKLQSKQDHLEQQPFDKAKSGSLFSKINYHFWQTMGQSDYTELKHFVNDDSLPKVHMDDSKLCTNLEKQLASVSLNSRKLKCIGKIGALLSQIDLVVDGKDVEISSQSEPIPKKSYKQDENASFSCLVPKFRWSYETPRNQKLKRPAASLSSELKPCILQTNDKSKILIELNSNANLNFLQQTLDAGMTPFYNKKNHFSGTSSKMYNPFVSQDPSFIPFLNNNGPLFNSVTEFPFRRNKTFNNYPAKPRQFNFGKTNEPQTILFDCQNDEYEKENGYNFPNKNIPSVPLYETKLPCTVTSENSYPLPFNHSSQGYEQNFAIDEQLCFPPIPELSEPSPLQLFPRKDFDVE